MDAGRLSICGEESFGTGSDHIREKDGCWAVLAWLSILAHHNADSTRQPGSAPLVSVQQIVEQHWRTFGRNYYSRFDYENVESAGAAALMAHLNALIADFASGAQSSAAVLGAEHAAAFELRTADQFAYTDPIDGSVSRNQGARLIFADGSRVIFRLSGTGSQGATVRVYIERFVSDPDQLGLLTQDALRPLAALALAVSKLREFTGREAPTVIT